MPQLGSESSPMMIKGKRAGKVLGMIGKFYNKDSHKKYQDNYDRIFKKGGNRARQK
tara:strand:- start:933 stop:1100 length:168 start_codon:yes stop_codon:yes gene_type:complete